MDEKQFPRFFVVQTADRPHAPEACSAAPAAQVSDRAKRLGARDFVAKEDAFEQLGPAMAKLVA